MNFYDVIPKEFLDKDVDYPNKKILNCKLPAVWNFTGPTGSGKSNAWLNVFKAYNCFNKVYFFSKSFDEPLYRWFIHMLEELERLHDTEILFKSNDLMDLPPLDEVDPKYNNLFIFDDMIGEKDKILEKMSHYAIRGRKRQASFWFLGQDYFRIPGLFRKQQNYVVLTGINTWEDLKRIMREMAISIPWEVLVEMYKEVQNLDSFEPKPLDNFFMIDNVINNPLVKCRLQFTPMDPRPYFTKVGLPVPTMREGKFVEPKKRSRDSSDDEEDRPLTRKFKRKTMDQHWKEEQKEVKRNQTSTIDDEDEGRNMTKTNMMVHRHKELKGSDHIEHSHKTKLIKRRKKK